MNFPTAQEQADVLETFTTPPGQAGAIVNLLKPPDLACVLLYLYLSRPPQQAGVLKRFQTPPEQATVLETFPTPLGQAGVLGDFPTPPEQTDMHCRTLPTPRTRTFEVRISRTPKIQHRTKLHLQYIKLQILTGSVENHQRLLMRDEPNR